MSSTVLFWRGERDKQQSAAVWQKEKDDIQVGGGRGGSSHDGK